jgi:PTH1 family peptidyl-tRNA hydrolase
MKLIVGLGNPGAQYANTRHNAGYMAIDRLAQRAGLTEAPRGRFHGAVLEGPVAGQKCLLVKPTTYMNRSGTAVAEALAFYKIDAAADLLIIVDEVALPCGQIRLRPSGGAGGHNGLKDIQQRLGTEAYPRLRIGIGPKPAYIDDQADYVLGRFGEEQWPLVEPAIDRAAQAAETFVKEGIDAAMNRFNVPSPTGPDPDQPGSKGGAKPESPIHPGWTN